jgi:putative PIN family toxin of toxin-antitoxin system
MRLTLDTNIVVSALWGGTSLSILKLAENQIVEICTCVELMQELKTVLGRRKFSRQLALTGISIDQVLSQFGDLTTSVLVPRPYPQCARDPDDDLVLACAVASQSSYIVSGDKDLLVLKNHQKIPILPPKEVLLRIVSGTSFP